MIINNWHQLEISKLTLHFYSHNINKKPYKFIGSAWRGMFGNILSKAVCNYNAPVCFNCPSAGSCSYPTLFKPLNNKLLSPFWLHRFYTHNNNYSNSCDYDVDVCWIGQHSYEISYWLEALAKFTHKEPYHLSISKNYNSDRIYFKNANDDYDYFLALANIEKNMYNKDSIKIDKQNKQQITIKSLTSGEKEYAIIKYIAIWQYEEYKYKLS